MQFGDRMEVAVSGSMALKAAISRVAVRRCLEMALSVGGAGPGSAMVEKIGVVSNGKSEIVILVIDDHDGRMAERERAAYMYAVDKEMDPRGRGIEGLQV